MTLSDTSPRVWRFWSLRAIGKSIVSGLAGSAAQLGLMSLKSWAGILPSFRPYDDLQQRLGQLVGGDVHPLVPWALSFINGALILSLVFGQTYRWLPGQNGATKGLTFGVLGWVAMGVLFFPLLGRGLFATQAGLGIGPALVSLAMVLTYSVVLGIVYAALNPARAPSP